VLAKDHRLILDAAHALRNAAQSVHDGTLRHNDLEQYEILAIAATGGDTEQFIKRLRGCLVAFEATPRHRLQAAYRLLLIATHHFRRDLAEEAASCVRGVRETTNEYLAGCERFEMHFALNFGDMTAVAGLAERFLHSPPGDVFGLSKESVGSEVAYALRGVGLLENAEALMAETFESAQKAGSRSVAHWCACAVAEWRIDDGHLQEAREWLSIADELQKRMTFRDFTGGRSASWIRIALLEGRPDDAERILETAEREHPATSAPRMRATAAAYRLHIARLKGQRPAEWVVDTLASSYELGRDTLSFDEVMAALWYALSDRADVDVANFRLAEYIKRRRPLSPVAIELRLALEASSNSGAASSGVRP
jgi:hypothetical protein